MTRNEIPRTLAQLNVRPNRQLGQSFLLDSEMAQEICGLLDGGEGDTVVEIGPGLGALSDGLVETSASRFWLIEKDARLAVHLEERFRGQPGVTVHAADALHFDRRPLFALQPVKLIGNLPYSTGTEILRRFLDEPTPVSRAVVMLQREVADRIVAPPRCKAYGPLSVRLRARWIPRRVMEAPPECFYPRPAVHSVVLELLRVPGAEQRPFDSRWLDRLVRLGFGQRRKQLRNRLEIDSEEWACYARQLGIAETARAEELDVDRWLELARLTDPHPLKGRAQSADEIFDVVDADDRVIGCEKRGIVHERHLLHRAVHVFVFNPRGELFLQKRSHWKDSHPGRWDSSASGHLDSGESYHRAAVRELAEELDLPATGLREIGRVPASGATGWEHVTLYLSEGGRKIRYPCSEIETGGYFPLDVIENWIARRPDDFATGFLECWKTFRASRSERGVDPVPG